MYYATYYEYENGSEEDEMIPTSEKFETVEDAIDFIETAADEVSGLDWAGATVEDDKGNYVYELTTEYERFDNR